MSKVQLDAILELAAKAPPPANATPDELRAWFEMINAQTPQAPGVVYDALKAGPWAGEWVRPPQAEGRGLIIYFHGGGFVFGSSVSHRTVTSHLALLAERPVLSIDYRLAPEHSAPTAHDDCYAAYRWALGGYEPAAIALAGDSAGGNLALSTALRARDDGLQPPGCVVMLSPALDLAGDGDSHTRLREAPLLTKELIDLFNRAYARDGDLRSPSVTPFYSDLSDLPPTLVHVGSNELLLDDSVTVAERIRQAGGQVELKVWQDMVHCWQLYGPMLEESMQSMQEVARFIQAHTG